MPKPGKRIKIGGEQFLVKRQMPLQESILVHNSDREEIILGKSEWKTAQIVKKENPDKKRKKER